MKNSDSCVFLTIEMTEKALCNGSVGALDSPGVKSQFIVVLIVI